MAKVIKTNLAQWNQHMQQLGKRFIPAVERGTVSGAMRCIPHLQKRTSLAPPATTGGKKGAVDTGLYKMAWKSSPISGGARVYNPRPYSGTVEYGRRPAPVNRQGIRQLQTWAKRNLNLSDKEAKRAAFAIARKMSPTSMGGGGKKLLARKVLTGDEKGLIRIVEKEILYELDRELAKK